RRERDADDRQRVEQARDDEHADLQHVRELRLTRRALEELAAEQAEADAGTERREAEDQADRDGGVRLDQSNEFHLVSPRLKISVTRTPSSDKRSRAS